MKYLQDTGVHALGSVASWFLNPVKVPPESQDTHFLALRELLDTCKICAGNTPSLSERTVLSEKISKLDPNQRGLLFFAIYQVNGSKKTSDPKWGRTHAMDRKDYLIEAIHRIAVKAYSELDTPLQNRIAGIVHQLAGSPITKDRHWGKTHAKDDPDRLLSALNEALSQKKSETGSKLDCRHFESTCNLKNRSCFYDLKRREIPGGQIVYVNGMGSSLANAKHSAERISTNFAQGYNVHGVYAASNGKYMDYAEAALGYGGVATTPAFILQKQVRDFLTRDPNAQCTIVCFSKGAIHTNNALATLEKPLRERITVLAVAPADLIPAGTCRKIRHFIITKDPVPFFSPSAHRIGKKDPDIVILPPHKDRSNAHNPHGPSYREAVSKEVDLFIKECKRQSKTH